VGEAQHAVAGGREVGVPCTVALERSSGAVVAVAVDLDDELLVAPEEVDLVSAQA
jgi:hypothetical protein